MSDLVQTPNGTFVDRATAEAAGLVVPKSAAPKRAKPKAAPKRAKPKSSARKAAGVTRKGK